MPKVLRNIAAVAYVEMLSIIRDRTVTALLFFTIILYLAVFGLVYKSGILVDIPVAVLDQDHSQTSQELVGKITNSTKLKVFMVNDTPQAIDGQFQSGKIRPLIVIPQHFEQDIKRGSPVRVSTEIDGSNLIIAYNLRKAISDINRSVGSEILSATLVGSGIEPAETARIMKAVDFRNESRYNPTYNYLHFLYLLLIIIALQQTCLLGEGLTLAREREEKTWIQFVLSPLSNVEIFTGKILPYFLIMIFNAGLVFLGSTLLLGLPMHGNMFSLLAMFAVFALSVVGMGFWISSYCRDTVQATMILCLFNIPMVLGSGLIWPFESMAPVVRIIAAMFPYTWMAHAARAITLKGASLAMVWSDLAALGALAVFYVTGAIWSVRRMRIGV